MNADSLIRAVNVRRWHTERMHGVETVGHHLAVVTLIMEWLTDSRGPEQQLKMMKAALHHDMGEYWVSDVSARTKLALGAEVMQRLDELETAAMRNQLGIEMPALTSVEQALLYTADNCAALLFAATEASFGNSEGKRIAERVIQLVIDTYCWALNTSTGLKVADLLLECGRIADVGFGAMFALNGFARKASAADEEVTHGSGQ